MILKRLISLISVLLLCMEALASKPARVACIGDSITYGHGIEQRETYAYPAALQRLLGDSYEVRNYGFSARTMSMNGDYPYMKEAMYEEAKVFLPDVVTIMLGTNDTKPKNWSDKDFADSYSQMINELKALPTHPEIFICTPPTVHQDKWGINDSTVVAGVIPILNDIADRHGLEIIDTHAATAGCGNHFYDSIHPDAQASEVIAESICSALRANGWGKTPGKKVVFAGDSITDGGWGNANGKPSASRNHYDGNHIYGHSYAANCASYYLEKYPNRDYRFYNRGISGDTLEGLEKRWDDDVLSIRPDVISIYVGVNDSSKGGSYDEFDFAGWEQRYRKLIESALEADKGCRIVVCTPFFEKIGKYARRANFEDRSKIVRRLASIVSGLAVEYKLTLVDYAQAIEKWMAEDKSGDIRYWVWDGIHPTYQAHLRMARLWEKEVGKI